jgi:hypothetical protein
MFKSTSRNERFWLGIEDLVVVLRRIQLLNVKSYSCKLHWFLFLLYLYYNLVYLSKKKKSLSTNNDTTSSDIIVVFCTRKWPNSKELLPSWSLALKVLLKQLKNIEKQLALWVMDMNYYNIFFVNWIDLEVLEVLVNIYCLKRWTDNRTNEQIVAWANKNNFWIDKLGVGRPYHTIEFVFSVAHYYILGWQLGGPKFGSLRDLQFFGALPSLWIPQRSAES